MQIEAKILLDTLIDGQRVTTFEITLPKFILAEFNTHRVFSRNFASSRAIPNNKILEYTTFTPDMWRINQKGMQPTLNTDIKIDKKANKIWEKARRQAKKYSEQLSKIGIAKELCNRLVEPFMYVKGIVTATDFNNFFELRCHADAQREIQLLASQMKTLHKKSKPKERDFHLPYILDWEIKKANSGKGKITLKDLNNLIYSSIARCARVSYMPLDNTPNNLNKDLELYKKLIGSKPQHFSPAEHQVFSFKFVNKNKKIFTDLGGNLRNVVQWRKVLELENKK